MVQKMVIAIFETSELLNPPPLAQGYCLVGKNKRVTISCSLTLKAAGIANDTACAVQIAFSAPTL